jgi:SNF2 family DNA or RNA helicase
MGSPNGITYDGKWIWIRTPYEYADQCRSIPGSRTWRKERKAWRAKPSRDNVSYLWEQFQSIPWDQAALDLVREMKEKDARSQTARIEKAKIQDAADLDLNLNFETTPYIHQKKALAMSLRKEAFGLFMEQGTGKTKVVIDNAAFLYHQGLLDAVVVIAPNSVKGVWAEEITLHLDRKIDRQVFVYQAGMKKSVEREFDSFLRSDYTGLKFLVLNVEAFSQMRGKISRGEKIILPFMLRLRTMMVVDESTRIKNPQAKRTKSIVRAAKASTYRRILTGTPVTQGLLDLYAPFKFLDEDILGYSSFYAYRNKVAVLDPWGSVEFFRKDGIREVKSAIEPHTYRVLRSECLDLPDKIYQKRIVELSKDQAKAYRQMADQMIVNLEEMEVVTAAIVLTQLLRLQQITGGFLSQEEGKWEEIPGPNPKLDALMEIVEETQGKVVIWARFLPEIYTITDALANAYGADAVASFHGGVKPEQRDEIRRSFQDPDSPLRFFVGNAATAGMGLTLTQGKTVIYYSNSFSLEERLQSEDRTHRIGQDSNVLYVDLVANVEVDKKVVAALRAKKNLSDLVTGDNVKDWI